MGYKLLPKCSKCLYKRKTSQTRTCDYILIVGHSRGCSIEDCEFYKHNVVDNPYSRFQLTAKPQRDKTCRHGMHLSLEEKDKLFYPFYRRGYNDHRIAKATGWSAESVWKWRNYMGYPAIKTSIDTEKLDKIKELFEQGLTDVEIGEQVGLTHKSVETYRLRMGLMRNVKKTEDVT